MARASDRLNNLDARAASKQLFDASSASSHLSPSRTLSDSARLKQSTSNRLRHGSSNPADAKAARAEKKLSKYDRKALEKKYAKRTLALTSLAARMAFDASDDSGPQATDALNTAATLRAVNSKTHSAERPRGERVSAEQMRSGAGRRATLSQTQKKAKESAEKQTALSPDTYSANARASASEVQKATEKHIDKMVSTQAKERARDVVRKSAAQTRTVRRCIDPSKKGITERLVGILFPSTSKEAVRQGVQRAIRIVAAGVASAIPFIFAGFILLLVLTGATQNSGWNMDGLSDSERIVATYLKDEGFSKVSSAAILGNMRQESGVDPARHQINGPGRGLLQWEEGSDRFSSLCALAQARGKTWADPYVQLEYLLAEAGEQFDTYSPMQHTYPSGAVAGLGRYMSFREWSEIEDIAWATESWERVYTRASAPMMEQRISYARAYLAILNRGAAGGGSTQSVIDSAFEKMGAPYVFGAAGPDSFDCSGFVKWCFEQNGIELGGARTADQIYRISIPIAQSDAQAGDIVVFTYGSPQTGEAYGHIGIYLGDGMMIETSSPPTGVNVRPVGANGVYGRL